MGMMAAMALVCFVSANPSPQHWLVSGRVDAVARMDALVAATTEARRIAHAEDGDIAFSRYAMGANPSNLVLYPLIARANHDNMLTSRFQHIVPSCPSGERGDVGNRRSDLVMGLIGPVAAIAKLDMDLEPAFWTVQLDDGRTGLGIALRDADRDVHDALIRRAAAGMLAGIDLVLMRPRGAVPRVPDRARRTDSIHMGS